MPYPPRNLFPIFVAIAALAISAMSCGGMASSPEEPAAAPGPLPTQPLIFTPTSASQPPVIEGAPTPAPAIPERRRLTLEFPAQIRAGDSDIVRLTLEVDDLGSLTPTAQFEGNLVGGEVIEIPDLYATHHVIAEARFDIAGMQVSPPDLSSQTLSKGQSVTFYWSVRPPEAGVYRGTIWFHLRFVEKAGGRESQKTVSAQIVEIEAVNFLGLPAGVVRTAGGVGSIVGAVIGFPFFEDIVKFLLGRRAKRGR